jgi:hypothetical protein
VIFIGKELSGMINELILQHYTIITATPNITRSASGSAPISGIM